MTRSRSIRVVLLLALLLILCLTTLPGPMIAQEQGEGMVECLSSSEDATVRLEFPAGGGEVHGSYQSSYTAQDVSLLYDEDGSSDHYAERRRVTINVQVSGSYSGGEEGVFALQVTGGSSVDIDNLEDDRFDRSYRAELDASATGARNADGSITLGGMAAEFVPVAKNAKQIPNTRWLQPPSVSSFGDLTLPCTGWPEEADERAQPPDVSPLPGQPQPNGPPHPSGFFYELSPLYEPSEPPPPPPAPPPMGECGSVQVIYLDDLGIEPNEADIDAFIENALAIRGPDYSLILSHRQRLVERFGQEGFEEIDALLQELGYIAETCPFVLIVGDPDVVPFAVLANPTDDGDVLFTDDVYGDNDHDELTLPDIPVARIPDGRSLELLVAQLSPSHVPEQGNFTLANSKRLHAEGIAREVFGSGRTLLWSLPTRHEVVDPAQVSVRHDYFMLHGASWDTSVWWGEESEYPVAFTVAEADSRGVVLSGACYASYTFERTPLDSIPLAFLRSGARAFVGATGITYSPLWEPGPEPTGPMRYDAVFHRAFLDALSNGQPPLAAFMEAKERMADTCETVDATSAELKMLHAFVYFGKP